MSRVRCAVIGSGFAGSTYAEAVRYAPDAELVIVAGGRRAGELAALHGVRAVADVDAVLDSSDVDAVLIASPNPFHAPQTVRAAQAGKHVLVEKPMALSVAECRAMVDACQRNGVVLMVGHHHRFRRNGIAAKLLLDRGSIGRVDMAAMVQTEPDQTTWLTKPENGGYLLGGGVHGLDMLRWWLGDVRRVAALTGQYRGEHVENGSLLLLEFASGAHASFQESVIPGSVPPPGSGVVRFDAVLTGERGVLQVDMYGEVRTSTRDGWQAHTSLPVWDGHYAFLRMEAYASQVRELVAAIREARPPSVAATDGLAAVAIVEAAHRAAAAGSWQEVEQP
ncbi:MAG TPA: Gfo/Idh/MocA family oxidoreductase [Chloroflexota bacterium]|jgi:predicted dehydrogenase